MLNYSQLILGLVLVTSYAFAERSDAQEPSKQQVLATSASQKSDATPTTPPSLSSLLTQTVVFIYEDKTPPNSINPTAGRVLGTAFLVGIPVPGKPDQSIPFIVTARHVLADQSNILVRFTPKTGSEPGFAQYDLESLNRNGDLWNYPGDDGVDLVIFRTPVFDKAKFLVFPVDMIAARDTFNREFINVADRIMIPCLYGAFPGVAQNYPIFRDGSIALIAEEPIQFSWKLGSRFIRTSQKVILINAVVNEGFSGAPVFLWPGMRLTPMGNTIGGKPWLIGIVHGFLPEYRKIIDAEGKEVVIAKPDPGLLGQINPPRQVPIYSQENSATGLIFPAWLLADILQSEPFKKRMEQLSLDLGKPRDNKKNHH